MSSNALENEAVAKQTEQQVIIKICDDLCKTPTESEQTTKETREHRNRYISLIYNRQK